MMEFYSFTDFLIFDKKIKEIDSNKIMEMWNMYKDEYKKFCKKNNYIREEF